MDTSPVTLVAIPGGWELVLIVAVIILIFGAAKLPELARGTGQALRIFKAETKGLRDDDKDDDETHRPGELNRAEEPAEGEIVDEPRRDNAG